MKKTQPAANWYFVDESGDPTFYDRHGNLIVGQPGCSPILILGFIETGNPHPMRAALADNLRDSLETQLAEIGQLSSALLRRAFAGEM